MRKSMIDEAKERLTAALAAARALGAAAAKLSFRQAEHVGCRFEGGRLKGTDTRHSLSLAVEVVADGRRAGATGNEPSRLDEIVRRAVELVKVGGVAHFRAYPAPSAACDVKTHSPATAELPREALIGACEHVVAGLKAYNADLFIEAAAGREESESVVVTSGGVCAGWRQTGWSLSAEAQRTEGTDMLFAGWSRRGVDPNDQWDPDLILRRTLEDLRNGERVVAAPVGRVTAFLPPEVLRMLLGALVTGVSGRNVAKGVSPLGGRLGEKILDDCLTVIDDPHADYQSGARAIDDDGIPTRVMPIVADGVLANFLYDLDSAGLAGAEPTGNSHCAPYALKVLPGGTAGSELLAGIDDGLYIRGLLGFGQGNLMNGDFACNVGLGFRIRGGRIVGRVKDTMVAGNVYELLKSNVRLGSDVDAVTRMPSAVVEGISVSAADGG